MIKGNFVFSLRHKVIKNYSVLDLAIYEHFIFGVETCSGAVFKGTNML